MKGGRSIPDSSFCGVRPLAKAGVGGYFFPATGPYFKHPLRIAKISHMSRNSSNAICLWLTAFAYSLMKKFLSSCALVAFVIFAELSAGLTSTQTHAGLIVFNTLPPAAPSVTQDPLSFYEIIGQSFLSGSGVQLTSVKALLSSSNLASTGTAQIALWSSNAQGELGSMLASQAFADSTVTSGSSGVYTFDPTTWTGSVALVPSTEYWITFTSVNNSSAVRVGGNYSSAGFGVTNTQALYGNIANPTYGSSTNGTYNMEIQVALPEPSAVPEIDPNSLGSVLALVLGSLGLLERRRLKAA